MFFSYSCTLLFCNSTMKSWARVLSRLCMIPKPLLSFLIFLFSFDLFPKELLSFKG